jgi:DNA-binding MarR family transcriptional regulator
MDIIICLTQKRPNEENALTVNLKFDKARINLNDLSQLKEQKLTYKIDGMGNGIWSFKEPAINKKSSTYKVLECIDEGLKKQTEIGNKIGISQPAVSQTFKDLREKRYIDENNDVTDKGRKILDDHSRGD